MKNIIFSVTISVVCILTSATADAALQYHKDTLSFDQALDFSEGTSRRFSFTGAGSDTACTARVDFFYTNVEQCCLAIGCNCGFRMGSSGRLYLSKVLFGEYDFTKALVLNSSAFVKGTTARWSTCKNLAGFSEPSENGMPDYSNYEPYFMVLRTGSQKTVLLRISYIAYVNMLLPLTVGYQGNDRIIVSSWTRNDTVADFKEMGKEIVAHPATIRDGNNKRVLADVTFSLLGKRCGVSELGRGVVIVYDRNCGIISKKVSIAANRK